MLWLEVVARKKNLPLVCIQLLLLLFRESDLNVVQGYKYYVSLETA